MKHIPIFYPLFVLYFLNSFLQPNFAQENLSIQIQKVIHIHEQKDSPNIYNIEGVVTLPYKAIYEDTFCIVVYTKSDKNSKIHLQFEDDLKGTNIRPKTECLRFCKSENTVNWKMQINLGAKTVSDSSCKIYAVVIRPLSLEEGVMLIRTTHDEFFEFNNILHILKGLELRPLVWTYIEKYIKIDIKHGKSQ